MLRRFGLLVLLLNLVLATTGWCGTLVQFRTQFGTMDVELYDQDKPVTVKNFLRYVNDGSYVNMFAHRGVANFIIQGGVYYFANAPSGVIATSLSSFYPPITNEINVGRFYSNKFGTIAMAKTDDPNSATSQFFFNLADNASSLDIPENAGGFTVFGHVVKGTNILTLLNAGATSPTTKIFNVVLETPPTTNTFKQLPLVATATGQLKLSDFILFDITTLNVQVTNLNNKAQISWTTVNAQTNFVEYTTNFPPVWQSLTNFIGNGATTNVTDSAAGANRRFYRVRVTY